MQKKDEIIKKDTKRNKDNKNVVDNKDKIRKNIYYIYGTVFIGLIVILMAMSIYSNSKINEVSNMSTNRKNSLNSEKNEKILSENVKNAENNTDSEISSKGKEVSGDNLEDNKEDNNDKKNDSDIKKEKSEEENEDKPKKKVYLTFDDGPSEITEKILNILKEHESKASFFVCYHKGEKNKKLYKRIVNEGHTIGVHSYTHNYKTIYSSENAFEKDVKKMRNYIKDVTGVETNIYRFPGGSGNKVSKVSIKKCIKILNKESMIYFDWNVENGDATGKKISEKQLINNVVKNVKTKNTPIVLMHDSATKKDTAKTLPKIIKTLKKQGYQFVGLNEDTPRIQQRK